MKPYIVLLITFLDRPERLFEPSLLRQDNWRCQAIDDKELRAYVFAA